MNLALARTLTAETAPEAARAHPWSQDSEVVSELQREAEIVERVLLEVGDLSSLSAELLRKALDLGVWYHFNPFRSSAVRVLDLPSNCSVLEIGCGAGAVTRYLAEQGFRVTAVESSPELARCARLRCQGFRNVDIVESYLDVMTLDEKFDLVVCLDPTLAESEFYEPGLELFAMCRKVLRSTGSLVLAVGNPIHHMADGHIELSRDDVRGQGAPLGSLRDSLASAGFPHHETFLAFPHHAAPRLLVEPLDSRSKRVDWLGMMRNTFKGSVQAMAQLERWWKTIHAEYLDSALAPGWVLVAHSHHVHAPLWNGWAASEVVAVADGVGAGVPSKGAARIQVVVPDSELVSRIESQCALKVTAHRDVVDQLAAGETKVAQLSKRHRNLRSLVAHRRLAARQKLRVERRARKNREAELELVLNHSRAVGALWGTMKSEKAKLEERVVGLQEQCEASEERLLELAARIHEAELELKRVKTSRLWRLGSLLRKLGLRRI
jgi:SAM-dependent methyltransferase